MSIYSLFRSLQLVSRLLTVDDLLGCIVDKALLWILWNSVCAGDMPFVVCGVVQYINKNCYKASSQSLPSVRAHLIVFVIVLLNLSTLPLAYGQ